MSKIKWIICCVVMIYYSTILSAQLTQSEFDTLISDYTIETVINTRFSNNGYRIAYVNWSTTKMLKVSASDPKISFTASKINDEANRLYYANASDNEVLFKFGAPQSDLQYLGWDGTCYNYVNQALSTKFIVVLTGNTGFDQANKWDTYPFVYHESYLFQKVNDVYYQIKIQNDSIKRVNGQFDDSEIIRLYASNGQRVAKLYYNDGTDNYGIIDTRVNIGGLTSDGDPINIVPTRAGYTLLGWSDSPTGEVKYTDYLTVVKPTTANRFYYIGYNGKYESSIYAIWQKNLEFTITEDSAYIHLDDSYAGRTLVIPETVYPYVSKKFVNWDTEKDGQGTTYLPGTSFVLTSSNIESLTNSVGDFVLYPLLLRQDTITFHRNFSLSDETIQYQYTYETEKNTLDACRQWVKSDSIIAGWAISPNGTIVYSANSTIITMGINIDLYAIWKKECIITLNDNHSSSNNIYQSGTENTGMQLYTYSEIKFVNPNWDRTSSREAFVGWNFAKDGSKKSFNDGDQITIVKDTTLYAQWQHTYVISYNGNRATSGSMTNDYIVENTEAQLKSNAYKNGSSIEFLGWATSLSDANNHIVAYKNNESLIVNNDLNLYAVWRSAVIGDTVMFFSNNVYIQEDINTHDIITGRNTGKGFVWILEASSNDKQFYFKNYLSGYYLSYDNGSVLMTENKNNPWTYDEYIHRFYYQDENSVKHYVYYNGSELTTITTYPEIAATSQDNELLSGHINIYQYILNALDETILIYDTIGGLAPASVYTKDITGHQVVNLDFYKNKETWFNLYNGTYKGRLLNETKLDISSASNSVLFKSQSGFNLLNNGATQTSNKYNIKIDVTPIDGLNLKNVKNIKQQYIDYVDSIIVSIVVDDTIHYTKRIAAIRRTYYDKDDDIVTLSLKDGDNIVSSLYYDYDDISSIKCINLYGRHTRCGNLYYAYNNALIHHGTVYIDHDLIIDLDEESETDEFTVHIIDDLTGAIASWNLLSYEDNSICIQMADSNNTGINKSGKLVITNTHSGIYNTEHHSLLTSISIPVIQGSMFDNTSYDKLIRNKGIENNGFDERGLQKVHTLTKEYYYIPGSSMILAPRERYVGAWQLWYDYNTLRRIPDSIAPFPSAYSANGSTYFYNIGSGEYSLGIYGTTSNNIDKFSRINPPATEPAAKVTINIPNTWTGTHKYAVDLSNYADYGAKFKIAIDATLNYIYEPTLSYRQIWTLHHADDMVEKMNNSKTSDSYVEEYKIITAAEQGVTLTKNYHVFNYENLYQLCYIVKDNDGNYHRIGDSTDVYYKDGSLYPRCYITYKGVKREYSITGSSECRFDKINDYLIINGFHSSEPGDAWDGISDIHIIYSLEAGDYKIAKWDVTFKPISKIGPLSENDEGVAIITSEDIHNNYIILSETNFDYNKPKTSNPTWYTHPLSWEESSSGFYYPALCEISNNGSRPTDWIMRGEYGFVNTTKDLNYVNYMATFNNRSGVENGYLLMTDASSEAGLMASLNVNGHLCSGLKMHCSAWVGNLNSSRRNQDYTTDRYFAVPTLLFNICGKNDDETEWHTVSQYTTGEIERNITTIDGYDYGTWYQINFEIDLSDDYDKYQIDIYDFAPTGQGNDFVLDDIIIYANELPLTAYQASTSCETDNVKSIIRMDYEAAKQDMSGYILYYQVWNKSDNESVLVEPDYMCAADSLRSSEYGSIAVPSKGIAPSGNRYASLSALVEAHDQDTSVCLGFVKEHLTNIENPAIEENRWVLYLVHDAPMLSEKDYEVRIAYDPSDLSNTECALTALLPVTNAYELMINGDIEPTMTPTTCGNEQFELSLNVNTIAFDPITSKATKLSGLTFNDWIILENISGDTLDIDADPTAPFDINEWRSKDGYTFQEIENALRYDLRADDSPNRLVTSLSLIDMNYISEEHYLIIYKTIASGELIFGSVNNSIYIRPNDLIRMAILPVTGTAYDETGTQIRMCYSYSIVSIAAPPATAYSFDNGKYPVDSLPLSLKNTPVKIRISLDNANNSFAMNILKRQNVIIPNELYLESSNDPDFDFNKHWFAYEPDKKYNFDGVTTEYYADENDQCILNVLSSDKCPTGKSVYKMKQGYEYTFRIDLLSIDGITTDDRGCKIGIGYFTLAIVPDYEKFVPGKNGNNNWQDDANWVVIDAFGNEMEESTGYVPMNHTNVIIPCLNDTVYPIISNKEYGNNKYDMYYQTNNCNGIYFEYGAKLGEQSILNYSKAFVDITMPISKYYMMSLPIKDVYSGDMSYYTDGSDNIPFEPKSGETNRVENTTYISTYNNTHMYHDAYNETEPIYMASSGWSEVMNALNYKFGDAESYALMSWPLDESNNKVTIRLPRADNKYYYYYQSGDISEYYENISRNSIGLLAYHGDTTYTLTASVASEYFMFGNPTMAYIDIKKLIQENSSVLDETFYYMNNNSWNPLNISMIDFVLKNELTNFCLSPMNGIMLKKKGGASTSLSIRLTDDMLSIYLNSNVVANSPRRNSRINNIYRLTIVAEAGFDDNEIYKSKNIIIESENASDSIVENEDLMMLASNNYSGTSGYFATPLNMFILDNGSALSVDARKNINILPLLFSYGDNYTPHRKIKLWFYGVNEFDYNLYLCDTITGNNILIKDGEYIEVETPNDSEVRYYIKSEKHDDRGDQNVPTSINNILNEEIQYIINDNKVTLISNNIIEYVYTYDITGKLIKVINMNKNYGNFELSKGIYILNVKTKDKEEVRKIII